MRFVGHLKRRALFSIRQDGSDRRKKRRKKRGHYSLLASFWTPVTLCPMPRSKRLIEPGFVYHVLNRGNGRMLLFHKHEDFEAFERVLAEGLDRYPVNLLTYCLMGNHWHLVLRPRRDETLSALMRWIGVTHVRRHHQHHHTSGGGHLYQGRFKSFPV